MSSTQKLSSIDAVIFDIGGVLLDFDHAITWRSLAEMAGADWEHVRDFLVGNRFRIEHELGSRTSEEIFKKYSMAFQPDLTYEKFYSAWARIFEAKRDVIELARYVSKLVPTYILSNTDPIHFKFIVDNYDFIDIFSGRVLSYEVGFRKPDEAIYKAAISLAGCPAARCLFFDDMEEHVVAGSAAEMVSYKFVSASQMRDVLKKYGFDLQEE